MDIEQMIRYTVPPMSWLFYGPDGSGKSWMVGSAMKDIVTGQPLRNGIVLDLENKMGHLELPDGTLWDLRPGLLTPKVILKSVRAWIAQYRARLAKGEGDRYSVIGLDSLTEYQFLYRLALAQEAASANTKEDPEVLSERSWGKIYDRIALDLGYLKPQMLGAHFIATAGLMRLEDTETFRYIEAVEDGRLQPRLQGQLRRNIGTLFDMVVYVEKVRPAAGQMKGGDTETTHRYWFAKGGDFKVRNGQEHRGTLPPYLDGTATHPLQFDNILERLEGN